MSACVLFFIRCSNLTTVLYVPLHVYRTGNTPVTAVFEFSVDQGKLAVVMDQLNGKQSLLLLRFSHCNGSTLKSVHVKELNCFLYQPVHFRHFPFHLLFLSFCHARSFFFFFFFNVVPSSAHFHVAGPDKWIRGPWQVIAVVQHVQEYVFSIKFWLCFSLPAAHSYQVYLDTKTLIGPRANKWMVVSQGDKLLVGLHVTEYWMLIGRGRCVGYNRETRMCTPVAAFSSREREREREVPCKSIAIILLFSCRLSFRVQDHHVVGGVKIGVLSIGLASADVTAERDAWKRIATGKTGSKQR